MFNEHYIYVLQIFTCNLMLIELHAESDKCINVIISTICEAKIHSIQFVKLLKYRILKTIYF